MALHKLVTGRKLLVSIKYENLHSFKEGVILLCQSTLETRRISHLHGSALFTIPLTGNKIADKITSLGNKPKNEELEEQQSEEIIIPPEKGQQIIDDLRLF